MVFAVTISEFCFTDEDPEEDSGSRSPGLHSPHARSVASSRLPSGKTSPSKSGSKPGSASTRRSKVSSATTRLETPDMDLQESRLVMSSTEQQVDLRKRDKNFLHYYNKVCVITYICYYIPRATC